MIFTHSSGQQLRRPVFWDGGTGPVSPQPGQLVNGSGVFTRSPQYDLQPDRGTVSPARRFEIIHIERWRAALPRRTRQIAASATRTGRQRSGSWIRPGRCPSEQRSKTSRDCAADRQAKGFNAVMLMTIQPDMHARGPVGRNIDEDSRLASTIFPAGDSPRSTSTTSSTSTRSSKS